MCIRDSLPVGGVIIILEEPERPLIGRFNPVEFPHPVKRYIVWRICFYCLHSTFLIITTYKRCMWILSVYIEYFRVFPVAWFLFGKSYPFVLAVFLTR